MTTETLQTANQLQHRINEIDDELILTENFLHDAEDLYISDHIHGEVKLSNEARLDILNIVLGDLRQQKEDLEDRFRML